MDLTLSLAALIGLYTWRFNRHAVNLEQAASRTIYKEQLRHPLFRPGYETLLRIILDRVGQFFDGKESADRFPLTVRGLFTCIGLSVFYGLAFFMLFWAVGGPGTIGSTELLPAGWPGWQRGGLLASLFGLWVAIFLTFRWVWRHQERLDAALSECVNENETLDVRI